MAGTRALGVVYPLLAVLIGGSVVWAGWVVFACTAPTLLYVPAGAIVDRHDPRRVLMWSELLRVAALASLVVALGWWELHLWHLLVVAFCEAALSVFSTLAMTALIPAIVQKRDIGDAMAVQEGSVHVAVLAGRPLGGFLFGFGPVVPLVANLLLIGAFVGTLGKLNHSFTPRPGARLLSEIRTGVREVRGNPFLRVAISLTACTNLIFQALVIVFIATGLAQGTSTLVTGLVLAATGIGGVVGALMAPARSGIAAWMDDKTSGRPVLARLTDMAGLTRQGRSTLVLHTWLWAVALILIVVTDTPFVFAVALALMGMSGGLSNVSIRTVTSRLGPHIVGRAAGVLRLVSLGAAALGPLFGSALIMLFDVHAAVIVLLAMTLMISAVVTGVPALREGLSPGWHDERRPVPVKAGMRARMRSRQGAKV